MKAKTNTHHKKRIGQHQRRSRKFHSVYLPYLPGLLITLAALLLSGYSPPGATLAYATEMSSGNLLQATNSQRVSNGQGNLSINSKLSSAAQAKANDMVARNYWSHNTPDGQEPWVFINNAGYTYTKAGENLAYGFATSNDTVNGWMNSPSHKANLLDSAFTEVGFGFANSNDFNNSGQETVVVAMYGKPQVLSASGTNQPAAPTPTPTPAPASKPTPTPVASQAPTATPSTPTPSEQPSETPPVSSAKPTEEPVTTASVVTEPATQPVTRLASLAAGNAQWVTFAVGLICGSAIAALLIKHTLALRHLLRNSQHFVHHHPLFDTTAISLVIFGLTLFRTIGVIK